MKLNFRVIFRIVGMLIVALGLVMLVPFFVALANQEATTKTAFLATAIACCVGGFITYLVCKKHTGRQLKNYDGFLLIVTSYLFIIAISALPYVLSGCTNSYIDAFFEACSAFTTTGASIFTEPETLPLSILFWRSFLSWLGGLCLVTLVLALLPTIGMLGQNITKTVPENINLTSISPTMRKKAITFASIYIGFTAIETALLCACKLSLFDSIICAFGTIGTGGFSNYSDNIAHFGNGIVSLIIIVFMFLSSISFLLYFALISGAKRLIPKNTELKLYLLLIIICSVLITACLILSNTYGEKTAALEAAVFQVVSTLSTTGFIVGDYSSWPSFCGMLIFFLLFVGGCSASPAGGIKVLRLSVVLKVMRDTIFYKLHPNGTTNVKVNGRILSRDSIQNACSLYFLFILTIFVFATLISIDGLGFEANVSASVSCMSNIGLGFGNAYGAGAYSAFSSFSKIVLCFEMILGRVEIFTLLVIFTKRFWRSSH